MGSVLTIDLRGVLTVEDFKGFSRTPKGQKTCAVLALLATGPDMVRPRRWIESKLWSDRAPEQAHASLRQALAELKKTLGEYADCVTADRKTIALDQTKVAILMPKTTAESASADQYFLSGIDVKDTAFLTWLEEMRTSFAPKADRKNLRLSAFQPETKEIRIYVRDTLGNSSKAVMETMIGHEITKYIGERIDITPITLGPNAAPRDDSIDIQLTCEIVASGSQTQVFFKAEEANSGGILCSRFLLFQTREDRLIRDPTFTVFIASTSEQILTNLVKLRKPQGEDAIVLQKVRRSVADIFSYDTARLNAAEAQLLDSYSRTGNPSILVWLAWQKTTQVIEEATPDKELATELAYHYCRQALEREPHSAFVNALSSLVYMIHFDDLETSAALAENASGLGRFDPYVHAALATANMFAGRPKEAAKHSLVGTKLSGFTENKHWWELSHSLASLAKGDLEAAETSAEIATQAAPAFRAPKRVLLALYAHQNRTEDAVRVSEDLKKNEPSFTLDQFLNDIDYPATTIRNAGLLKDKDKFDF
ncbi:MAG: hypothetical protein AAF198_01195 [Pseudomonadota bacterium]